LLTSAVATLLVVDVAEDLWGVDRSSVAGLAVAVLSLAVTTTCEPYMSCTWAAR